MPRDKGLEAVVDYLGQHLGNEQCVKDALEYMSQLSKEDTTGMDNVGKQLVLRAISDFISEADVQVRKQIKQIDSFTLDYLYTLNQGFPGSVKTLKTLNFVIYFSRPGECLEFAQKL